MDHDRTLFLRIDTPDKYQARKKEITIVPSCPASGDGYQAYPASFTVSELMRALESADGGGGTYYVSVERISYGFILSPHLTLGSVYDTYAKEDSVVLRVTPEIFSG
ncbi:hypothetical protein ADEAN_000621800 [Angomonas deanei]|uniref:Uncharacterized protein n=1 Tax=Angomonas deanei TaxID=59799 RepID=A0A7G2CI48_9TRYP|nr:hypothetical protein ADEAN_000621800 [Angomonas deanei]